MLGYRLGPIASTWVFAGTARGPCATGLVHLKRDHLSSHRDSEELKPKTICYLGCMPLNTKQRQLQVHPQKPFTTFALDRSCWSKTLSVIAQVKVNCDCVLAFTLNLCPICCPCEIWRMPRVISKILAAALFFVWHTASTPKLEQIGLYQQFNYMSA